MANEKKGEVLLRAGGKDYKLRFSFNALCTLEAEFKAPVSAIFATLENDVPMRTIRSILKAGLESGEGHSFPHAQVGDIIDDYGIAETGEAIADAFAAAFGELGKKEGETPEDPPEEPPAGTSSE